MRKPLIILFLAANPTNLPRLALDEELRAIENELRMAKDCKIELKSAWAVNPSDLQRALLEHKPEIVHFSGHGSGTAGIVLHGDKNPNAVVTSSALSNLFKTLKDNIRIVVLNACYSVEQATAIVENIDFVVGMKDRIGDEAARKFSAAFYRALGFGRSVQEAFNLGVNELQLYGITGECVPALLIRQGAQASQPITRYFIGNDPDNCPSVNIQFIRRRTGAVHHLEVPLLKLVRDINTTTMVLRKFEFL